MSHRLIVAVAALVASLLVVPAAFAVKVHVRVEGKERTIFGATAPLIDVTTPRANALPENALDALGLPRAWFTADLARLQEIVREQMRFLRARCPLRISSSSSLNVLTA